MGFNSGFKGLKGAQCENTKYYLMIETGFFVFLLQNRSLK